MESIARLMKELPNDYEKDCIEQGIIQRRRGVSSPADLMMLSMFHLHNGCSLIEISEIARISKLGEMSDVAFMKRFEKCADWFGVINAKIASEGLVDYKKPDWMQGKTVVGIDASTITEKGRSGRMYRLHFALDLFKMQRLDHKVTDSSVGESIINFNIQAGYLVLGDRGYSTIRGIEHCMLNEAEYILRLRKSSFTLRDEKGDKIDMLAKFKDLAEFQFLDFEAYATNAAKARVPIRVCAIRKNPDAIAKAQKEIRYQERTKGYTMSDESKVFNEYIVVVTNIGTEVSAEEILNAYRFRWQIEIYFKRLKSILDYGELPKRRPGSAISWLNGKLMIALLIELIIARVSFSPEG